MFHLNMSLSMGRMRTPSSGLDWMSEYSCRLACRQLGAAAWRWGAIRARSVLQHLPWLLVAVGVCVCKCGRGCRRVCGRVWVCVAESAAPRCMTTEGLAVSSCITRSKHASDGDRPAPLCFRALHACVCGDASRATGDGRLHIYSLLHALQLGSPLTDSASSVSARANAWHPGSGANEMHMEVLEERRSIPVGWAGQVRQDKARETPQRVRLAK